MTYSTLAAMRRHRHVIVAGQPAAARRTRLPSAQRTRKYVPFFVHCNKTYKFILA